MKQSVSFMFFTCSYSVLLYEQRSTKMKNLPHILNIEKSLMVDILNLLIIGMALVLYGLVSFCF